MSDIEYDIYDIPEDIEEVLNKIEDFKEMSACPAEIKVKAPLKRTPKKHRRNSPKKTKKPGRRAPISE